VFCVGQTRVLMFILMRVLCSSLKKQTRIHNNMGDDGSLGHNINRNYEGQADLNSIQVSIDDHITAVQWAAIVIYTLVVS